MNLSSDCLGSYRTPLAAAPARHAYQLSLLTQTETIFEKLTIPHPRAQLHRLTLQLKDLNRPSKSSKSNKDRKTSTNCTQQTTASKI